MSNIPHGLTGPQFFLLRKLSINAVKSFNSGDASALIEKGLAHLGANGDLILMDQTRPSTPAALRQTMTP
ncbi:hypothetical protein [Alloyangia pacifica]|uniref:hypothetical protein n=1 Tax=Alloyangia pacifica TaxID=311180 RepID=UPI001CFC961A|nr:hypothetical protein [Alloyangia pacifica]